MSRHRSSRTTAGVAALVISVGATTLFVVSPAVASPDEVTTSADLVSAFAAAGSAGSTIVLGADLSATALAVPTGADIRLDLHGHSLTTLGTSADPALSVSAGSILSIEDAVGGASLAATGAPGADGYLTMWVPPGALEPIELPQAGSDGTAGIVIASAGAFAASGFSLTATGGAGGEAALSGDPGSSPGAAGSGAAGIVNGGALRLDDITLTVAGGPGGETQGGWTSVEFVEGDGGNGGDGGIGGDGLLSTGATTITGGTSNFSGGAGANAGDGGDGDPGGFVEPPGYGGCGGNGGDGGDGIGNGGALAAERPFTTTAGLGGTAGTAGDEPEGCDDGPAQAGTSGAGLGGTSIPVALVQNGGTATPPTLTVYATTLRAAASALPASWPLLAPLHFAGWSSDVTGGAIESADAVITAPATLFAQWSNPVPYVVTFDSQGGTAVEQASASYGDLVATPTAPTRTGYSFAGWTTAPTGGTPWGFAIQTVAGDGTLFAQWSPNPHTVTFALAGGSGSVPDETIGYGQTAVPPTAPTRTGHVFVGWFTADGAAWDFTTAVTSDLALVAHWTAQTSTVTFDPEGGSTVSPVTVELNHSFSAPADPTRSGFRFVGWYDAASDGDPWDFTTGISADLTLFAYWAPVDLATPAPRGHLTISLPSVAAGGSLTVIGDGFEPGSVHQVVLHSDPVVLGTVQVDGAGHFAATVTVPAETSAGEHEVIVGAASVPILITAPASASAPAPVAAVMSGLAATGVNTGPALALAALVLGVGAFLVPRARRRRPRER